MIQIEQIGKQCGQSRCKQTAMYSVKKDTWGYTRNYCKRHFLENATRNEWWNNL